MPTLQEDRCCQREPLINTYIEDFEAGKCLLETAAVQHVLSPLSLQMKWLQSMHYFGHQGDALEFENMTNSNYRHHAYRNYIDLIFGVLGRHNRRVVPACIVSEIRRRYPDPDGQYVGFVRVDDNGQPVNIDEAENL